MFLANYSTETTYVYIPVADIYVDFGIWYIPFIVFVVLAMTNAVNLTDGLDGLASGVTALVTLFFAVAGVSYGLASGSYFCAAVCGGCLGFLVFNRNPAKVFMGDTGSLALGGGLAAAAIVMKMELFLLISRAHICDRGAFSSAAGGVFQDHKGKKDIQDGAYTSSFREVRLQRGTCGHRVLDIYRDLLSGGICNHLVIRSSC